MSKNALDVNDFMVKPLDDLDIENARELRLNEIKLWTLITDFISFSAYLFFLYLVAYSNLSGSSYGYQKNLRNMFLNSFDNVSTFLLLLLL